MIGRTDATEGAKNDNRHTSRLSRRRLLKIIGAAGAFAIATPLVPGLLAKVIGASPSENGQTPKRVRKWAMVIDLRRCDGCQAVNLPPQCTAACIQGHYAPEPMQWIQVYEPELPGGGTQFIPVPCQHCQNAPCVNVCPVGATFATPEGIVLIDQERCIGCRLCMAACPYDRRFFNWGNPPIPPESYVAKYHPEHQVPAVKGTVMKCDFCPDMARAGKLPYCAQACPTNAIYYGDLEEDISTNGDILVKMSSFLAENQAYKLKGELGTKPRVWYIPGHGEGVGVGRSPYKRGRQATQWHWQNVVKGARTWTR